MRESTCFWSSGGYSPVAFASLEVTVCQFSCIQIGFKDIRELQVIRLEWISNGALIWKRSEEQTVISFFYMNPFLFWKMGQYKWG